MEYLLVMSLSGSTMMGIYLLLKRLLRDQVSTRLYYLITRVVVLFYLIPLPFLKGWYRKIIRAALPKGQMKSVQIPVAWTNSVVHVGQKVYINNYAAVQITVAGIWLFTACILMVRWILKYVRARHVFVKYADSGMAEKQRLFLAELKKQYGVRQPVVLYQGQDGYPTMTFGICKPVIICDRNLESKEAEMLIRHEMVHIRRLDVLWKILVRFVVILHWWNPVVRKLRREFMRVCEYSCDEIAMQAKTKEEVKEYLRLLINETGETPETGTVFMGWQNSFSDDVENIKERIVNLLKKKKWNRYVAGILVMVLSLCNSMTVFAYRDTLHQGVPENTPQEEVTKSLQSNIFCFTPDGEIKEFEPLQETEILYEKQFTDTEGKIYPYSDEDTVTTYRSCSHNFVSGTVSEHTKKSNGGCEVSEYHAQRCAICGNVSKETRIVVRIYDVCTH